MFLMRLRSSLATVVALSTSLTTLTLAPPARAATTADWACHVRADGAVPLSLKPADLARPTIDRRLYDLDCTFASIVPGPSPVTVCVAAPPGGGGRGSGRVLRRDKGSDTIDYRLRAEPGDVSGALPYPTIDLSPDLQPVYSVAVGGAEPGAGSVRHQLAFVAELAPLPARFLAEGDYGETISGVTISVHDGTGCGPLLWGPPDDSLGPFADYALTVRLPATCAINILEPIQFGVLGSFDIEQAKSGALGVRCSPGTTYTVALGEGNNAAEGKRRMLREDSSASPNTVLNYELFKSSGERWSGEGGSIAGELLSATGTGVLTILPVTARIPPGASPLPGTYRDAVIATLVY